LVNVGQNQQQEKRTVDGKGRGRRIGRKNQSEVLRYFFKSSSLYD
jgi:hypothetical protein